jgi:cellulose binding protein with CBM2 domain/fibronectin type III domain protein
MVGNTLTYIDVWVRVENMSGLRSLTVSRGARAVLTATALTASLFAAVLLAGPAAQGSTVPSAPTVTTGPPNPSPFPPGPPGDLTATAVTTGSVTLSWTASTRGCCTVTGYDITWGQSFNDVLTVTHLGDVTTVTFTSGIRARTQYFFQVSAHDDLGHRSAQSTIVVVTPATDTGPDIVPPSAPAGLTRGALTEAGLPLSWSPSTDNVGVVAYDVYRFDNWFVSELVGSTTATSYTVAPTAGGASLYVRARDAAGNVSIASGTVSGAGATTTPPTTTPPTTTPPPAPTCTVSYSVTAQWVRGFVAGLTVTNTGPAAVDGWTLGFTFGGDQKITSSWNGTVSQTGAAVTVTNARWNGALAPGASATVGLQGTWSGSNAPPSAFTLNGLPCSAA